jgi:hypothetical protein
LWGGRYNLHVSSHYFSICFFFFFFCFKKKNNFPVSERKSSLVGSREILREMEEKRIAFGFPETKNEYRIRIS